MTSTLPAMLRVREVTALLKVSRVTLWHWRRDGRFPEPLRLGPNTVAWPEPTIARWLREREGAA